MGRWDYVNCSFVYVIGQLPFFLSIYCKTLSPLQIPMIAPRTILLFCTLFTNLLQSRGSISPKVWFYLIALPQ